MAVFLITPLAKNADAVGAAIAQNIHEGDFYALMNQAGWFVNHKGTTVEVSAAIGITNKTPGEKPKLGSALVTPVTSYYGIGSSDMWEWLKSRLESQ